ncbi:MAG: DUF4388 domain-containing protein [Acidimicrobiia bacterium]|nr:DUF4388 domain-containing protein [Acidimicrobiia bacterium]
MPGPKRAQHPPAAPITHSGGTDVSLQGTFDTLPVTELLGLLARSRKTGLLHVETRSSEGRLWLLEGRCRAVEAGAESGPAATPGDLQERLVGACFDVARQDGGSFRFADGGEPPWPTAYDVGVDDALDEVCRLLEEWQEIRSVIPSLGARPRLSPDLRCQSMTIDAAQWRVLAALDGESSVDDVISRTQRSVMDVCNVLREMVERGAVELIAAPEEAQPDEAQPDEAPPEEAQPAEAAPGGAASEEAAPAREAPVPPSGSDGALADLADLAALADLASSAASPDPPRERPGKEPGSPPEPGAEAVVSPVEPYGPGVDPSEPPEVPHPATHRPVTGSAPAGRRKARGATPEELSERAVEAEQPPRATPM